MTQDKVLLVSSGIYLCEEYKLQIEICSIIPYKLQIEIYSCYKLYCLKEYISICSLYSNREVKFYIYIMNEFSGPI